MVDLNLTINGNSVNETLANLEKSPIVTLALGVGWAIILDSYSTAINNVDTRIIPAVSLIIAGMIAATNKVGTQKGQCELPK